MSATFLVEALSVANYLSREGLHDDEEKSFRPWLRRASPYVHPAPRKEKVMAVMDKSDAAEIKFRGPTKDTAQICCYNEAGGT